MQKSQNTWYEQSLTSVERIPYYAAPYCFITIQFRPGQELAAELLRA